MSNLALECSTERIGIALPVTGGAVGERLVVDAVDRLAATSDNVEKLANSGAAERHLAIYVDQSATDVLIALRDFEPPSDGVRPSETQ